MSTKPEETEDTQAVQRAAEQLPQDMPYCEVLAASLFKKSEIHGDRPGISVKGPRWYVEVEVQNTNDQTTATVLYRVWRAEEDGQLRAIRVTVI